MVILFILASELAGNIKRRIILKYDESYICIEWILQLKMRLAGGSFELGWVHNKVSAGDVVALLAGYSVSVEPEWERSSVAGTFSLARLLFTA
jgi:hypothetical protein